MSAHPISAGAAHQPLGAGPLLTWAGWVPAALAALSAGAGIIHGVVAVTHLGGAGQGTVFFAVAAVVQLALAGMVAVSAAPRVLAAGILGHGALGVVWLVSRTVGVPLGAHSGEALPVGLADGIPQLLQVLFIVGSALWLARHRGPVRWLVPRALAGASVVVLLAVVPLTAAAAGVVALEEGGDHAHGHETDQGGGETDDDGHDHAHADDHEPADEHEHGGRAGEAHGAAGPYS